MKKQILALILLILCVLSACSAGVRESSANEKAFAQSASSTYAAATTSPATIGGTAVEKESSHDMARNESGFASPASPPSGEISTTGLAAPDIGRKLIRTGYYSLETMDYPQTIQQIEELVNSVGGYIQSSSTSGEGAISQTYARPRYANYTVRIPADSFFSFGSSLGGIATVVSSSQSAEEVTDYYYDTEARLKTLRVQEERLLTLMGQATELEAIIMLEQSLGDVRYQIESNEGTLRRLDSQISFSTLHIDVTEVFTPTKIEPVPITLGERIGARFKSTMENMKRQGEGMLVVLIGDAPQILINLLIIGAIAWVTVVIVKKVRRRRAADESQATPPESSGKDGE